MELIKGDWRERELDERLRKEFEERGFYLLARQRSASVIAFSSPLWFFVVFNAVFSLSFIVPGRPGVGIKRQILDRIYYITLVSLCQVFIGESLLSDRPASKSRCRRSLRL